MVFTDPPYNVPIAGNVSGKGAITHQDFSMACGEMPPEEFISFLTTALGNAAARSCSGSIAIIAMDWRHMSELACAGRAVFSELKNVCIWVKDRPGMGTFYRSRHEMFFVFKHGTDPHINNFQLGQYGRNRSNVWEYPAAASFARSGQEGKLLHLHPTPKPVELIADAIKDCSKRDDCILDPFLGSGSTVIAAEKTGRVCYGIELERKYTDVVIRRWQRFTGLTATHASSGIAFNQLEKEAANAVQ